MERLSIFRRPATHRLFPGAPPNRGALKNPGALETPGVHPMSREFLSACRPLVSGIILLLGTILTASSSMTQPIDSDKPILDHYNLASKKAASTELAGDLREASGLAASADGRLYCHNDERGVVYAFDPVKGTIVKKFSVGERTLRQDYEGIAIADSLMFLVTSSGDIIEFKEAPPEQRASVRVYKTELGSAWDVEGLCYDPPSDALLLACKENPIQDRFRYIYAFPLRTHRLESAPRFVIDRKKLEKEFGIKDFRPTSIERHPASGSLIVLSSSTQAVLELSPSGKILSAIRLDESLHRQPEGLAIGPDLTLYICNEGKSHGTLVRYPYRH